MDSRYPDFATAVQKFRDFLAQNGWPTKIVWILPGQVVTRHRSLAIGHRSGEFGEEHARAVYAEAASRLLGVSIEALCHTDGSTYSRVARPTSGDAAARLMFPDGLKLTIPVDNLKATVVGPWLMWWLTRKGTTRWPDDAGDIQA